MLNKFKDTLKGLLINNSEEFITTIVGSLFLASSIDSESLINNEKIPVRREANVLTRLYFRDTDLENAHATLSSEILTYNFVENLMDNESINLNEWLIMRDQLLEESPSLYYSILKSFEIVKSLMMWNQDPIIGKGNKDININLYNYAEYEIDSLCKTLSENLKSNSVSFLSDIVYYCNGAIKKYQDDIDYIFEREIDEGRVISEICFARSIPTNWYGKDILTNSNMKKLMIKSSKRLTEWLVMRDTLLEVDEDIYYEILFLLAAALDV